MEIQKISENLLDEIKNAANTHGTANLSIDIHDLAKEYSVDQSVIDSILRGYENRGLMDITRLLGGKCNLSILY